MYVKERQKQQLINTKNQMGLSWRQNVPRYTNISLIDVQSVKLFSLAHHDVWVQNHLLIDYYFLFTM